MGQGQTPSYTYTGSFCLAIGFGPMDILHAIRNGDTVIWKGPIFRTSATAGGFTNLTTTIGQVRFYWGTANQTQDPDLASVVINGVAGPCPTYANISYAVMLNVAFGQQVTPPALTFIVSRFPGGLTLDQGCSRISITDVGHGYVTAPTVVITGGGGSGATAIATSTAGEITAVTMTNVGSGYTSAPSISFTGGSPGRACSAVATLYHEQLGDAEIAEVIYDLMTNSLYGAGVPGSQIDLTSFNDCANQLFGEGIAASVILDSSDTLRTVLGKLYGYGVVFPVYSNGKITLKKIRTTDTSSLVTVTEADLLEEPTCQCDGMDATFNWTRVSFTNADNDWQTDIMAFNDPANEAIVGRRTPNDVAYPWVTNPTVAQSIANRVGIVASSPVVTWNLKLKPSWKTLQPGAIVPFSYAALGISGKLIRVHTVKIGGAETPYVEITGIEEVTRDASQDYSFLPSSAPFHNVNASGTAGFDPLSSTPYLAWVPPNLLNGQPDGMLVALQRPNAQHTSVEAWWTWDETQLNYQSLGMLNNYPVGATILWWSRIRENNWLLRILVTSSDDLDYFNELQTAHVDVYIVMGQRNRKTVGVPSDRYLVAPLMGKVVTSGIFDTLGGNVFDIEISGAAYGTPDLQLEGLVDIQICPSLVCFIGHLTDFIIYPSSSIRFQRDQPNSQTDRRTLTTPDTALVRYVKAITRTPTDVQLLSEVTASQYARENFTGGPSGTLSSDWGPRVMTSYEMFDIAAAGQLVGVTAANYSLVADLDLYLGQLLALGQTSIPSNQFAMVEHLDKVMGFMVLSPATYYNEAGNPTTAGAVISSGSGLIIGDQGGTSGSVTPTPVLIVTYVPRTISGAIISAYVHVTNTDSTAQFTYQISATDPGTPTPGSGGWQPLQNTPGTILFSHYTLWVYCVETGKVTSSVATLNWSDVSLL